MDCKQINKNKDISINTENCWVPERRVGGMGKIGEGEWELPASGYQMSK